MAGTDAPCTASRTSALFIIEALHPKACTRESIVVISYLQMRIICALDKKNDQAPKLGCHPNYGNSINFIIVHPALSNWRLAGTWSASDRTYCGVNMSKNDSTVSVAFVVPHKGGRLSRSWASSSLLRCRHLRGVGHLMVPFHNYLPLDVFFP